jgi:hypothetical protein
MTKKCNFPLFSFQKFLGLIDNLELGFFFELGFTVMWISFLQFEDCSLDAMCCSLVPEKFKNTLDFGPKVVWILHSKMHI